MKPKSHFNKKSASGKAEKKAFKRRKENSHKELRWERKIQLRLVGQFIHILKNAQ